MFTEPLRIAVSLCLVAAVLLGRLAPECGCSHRHSHDTVPDCSTHLLASGHFHDCDSHHESTRSEPCDEIFDPPASPDCLCNKAVSPDASSPRLIPPDSSVAVLVDDPFPQIASRDLPKSAAPMFPAGGTGLRTLYCSLTC